MSTGSSVNRIRTRGGFDRSYGITESYNLVDCTNRTPYSNVYPCGWKGGTLETFMDVLVPGWHRRRGKTFDFNELIVTKETREILGSGSFTLTAVADTCSAPVIHLTDTQTGQVFANRFCKANPPPHGSANVSADRISGLVEECWTACLAARGDGQTNLLESIAESHQAIEMARHPFVNLATFIRAFKRDAKRSKRWRQLGDDAALTGGIVVFASSEWLRFRYGIMPIVNDIAAVMKVLETGYDRKPRVYAARAKKSIGSSSYSVQNFTDAALSYSVQQTCVRDIKVRAFWYDEYTKTPFQDLGFSVRNLVGLPWELLRMSFVVDWFVNAGDCIYANIPRPGYTPVGGMVTVEDDLKTVYSPYNTIASNPSVRTLTGGLSDQVSLRSYSKHRYQKTNGSSFGIKADFRLDNLVRLSDAIAIAVQQLKSINFDAITKRR